MKTFKLKKSSLKEYGITKKTFKEKIQERYPYVQNYPGSEENEYAYCSGCNNSVQVIGIYRKTEGNQTPYGKHYFESIPDIGAKDERLYLSCPFAAKAYNARLRKNIMSDEPW